MISEKDDQFLNYLSSATEAGKIAWQPTAADAEFTVSLKGKYNVVVGGDRRGGFWLRMSNEQGQVMLFITNEDDRYGRVEGIFTGARRIALSVDSAIDEIITEE